MPKNGFWFVAGGDYRLSVSGTERVPCRIRAFPGSMVEAAQARPRLYASSVRRSSSTGSREATSVSAGGRLRPVAVPGTICGLGEFSSMI